MKKEEEEEEDISFLKLNLNTLKSKLLRHKTVSDVNGIQIKFFTVD